MRFPIMNYYIIILTIVTQFSWADENFLNQLKDCDFLNQPSLQKNNVCFKNALQYLLDLNRNSVVPIMDFHLPDPFNMGNFPFVQSQGPLNIKAEFINVECYGFSNYTLINATTAYPLRTITIDIYFKKLLLEGTYTMDGNVILLPIKGNGDFYVNANDVTVEIGSRIIPNPNIPNMLGITDTVAKVTIGKADMQFLNLFADDPILDETMHHFLNTNDELIVDEINPLMNTKVAEFMGKSLDDVYANIPITIIYPDGKV